MATVTKAPKAAKAPKAGKAVTQPKPGTPAANPNPATPATANGVARTAHKGVAKTVVASTGVALRASWQGYSITSVLRYLGVHGCTVAQATAVMATLGLGGVVRVNTIKNQVQSGRRGAALSHFGPPAALTAAQGKQLMAMVPAPAKA